MKMQSCLYCFVDSVGSEAKSGSLGLGICFKILSRQGLREDEKALRTRKRDRFEEQSVIQIGEKQFIDKTHKMQEMP